MTKLALAVVLMALAPMASSQEAQVDSDEHMTSGSDLMVIDKSIDAARPGGGVSFNYHPKGPGGLIFTQGYARKEIWSGWMNLTPCSRVFSYRDDLGIRWHGIRWGNQELHGSVSAEFPMIGGIEKDAKECAIAAAGAAGLSSMLTSPASAMPVFKASLLACLKLKAGEQAAKVVESVQIEAGSVCRF